MGLNDGVERESRELRKSFISAIALRGGLDGGEVLRGGGEGGLVLTDEAWGGAGLREAFVGVGAAEVSADDGT